MNKTVEVHLKTAIWKRLSIMVPVDEDPKEFIDDLMEHDPTGADHPKEDVVYMEQAEEALEGQYYLPDEDYEDEFTLYGTARFPTLEANNLMMLLDSQVDNPMRALYELQQQARENGEVLADEVLEMNRHLKHTLTVSQVLDIIQQ